MGFCSKLQVNRRIPSPAFFSNSTIVKKMIIPYSVFFLFRPSFRWFTWHTCTLGIIGCLVMMFLINAIYAFASIAFMLLLIGLIHHLGPISNWGYISQALIFHQVTDHKTSSFFILHEE